MKNQLASILINYSSNREWDIECMKQCHIFHHFTFCPCKNTLLKCPKPQKKTTQEINLTRKSITTRIDLVWKSSAQVTYWDAIVTMSHIGMLLSLFMCWLESWGRRTWVSKNFDTAKCKRPSKCWCLLHFPALKCPPTQIGMHYKSNQVASIIRMTIASQ